MVLVWLLGHEADIYFPSFHLQFVVLNRFMWIYKLPVEMPASESHTRAARKLKSKTHGPYFLLLNFIFPLKAWGTKVVKVFHIKKTSKTKNKNRSVCMMTHRCNLIVFVSCIQSVQTKQTTRKTENIAVSQLETKLSYCQEQKMQKQSHQDEKDGGDREAEKDRISPNSQVTICILIQYKTNHPQFMYYQALILG